MFENADLIHTYTRADALRDGVLIDVSATTREAGIRWPVALRRTVRDYQQRFAARRARELAAARVPHCNATFFPKLGG
jgi:hypothetical protein